MELAEVEKANLNDENKTIETIIKEPNNEIDKTDIPINRKVDKFEKLSNESFLQEIYASNTKRNTSYKNRLSRLIKEVIENNLLDNNSMYSYLCSSKDKLIEDAAYFNLIDALEFKNIMSKKSRNVEEAMKNASIESINEEDLDKIIKDIVDQNQEIIKNQKERAMGPLMGIVMKELRGKASGEIINKLLLINIKMKLESN